MRIRSFKNLAAQGTALCLGTAVLSTSCEREEATDARSRKETKTASTQAHSPRATQGSLPPNGNADAGESGQGTSTPWRDRGEGTDRVSLLTRETKDLDSSALGDWLVKNATQLSDGDEAFFISLSTRLMKVPPEKMVQAINSTTSPDLRKRLLSAIKEQTSGILPPTALYALAATLQPASERNELVTSSIAGWLRTTPAAAIGSAGQAFDLIKGGDSSSTTAYIALGPVFAKVPKTKRDEAWNLLPSADERMRSSIASRIMEGQYQADSLDATAWLDSLPPSKEKSSAVLMLVNLLLVDGDTESARHWADSASSYLTEGDRKNIEFHMEEERKKQSLAPPGR